MTHSSISRRCVIVTYGTASRSIEPGVDTNEKYRYDAEFGLVRYTNPGCASQQKAKALFFN